MKIWQIFDVPSPTNTCTPSELMCSNSLIGVEHELEGATNDDYCKRFTDWNSISDGSLRDGGIEYVLKQPLAGEELIAAVKDLDEYVKSRSNIRSNERTSTHIHVDARDLTQDQLLMFFVVYTTFEQVLFSLCDESRTENNFCVPVRKNGGVIKRIRNVAKRKNSPSAVQSLGSSSYRYAAMNMASLPRFGSIEFRMRETLTDKVKLLEWINILLSMKQFAIEHGNEPVTDVVARFNSMDANKLTDFIFGDAISEVLKSSGMLPMHVADGAELARHIFHDGDTGLEELARTAEVSSHDEDNVCRVVEVLGVPKARYLSNLMRDRDPLYTYPSVNWDEVEFKLVSGAIDWWANNIKRARRIESRSISLQTLLSMKATLEKDSVRERTNINIMDLLTPASRSKYNEYKRDSGSIPSNSIYF